MKCEKCGSEFEAESVSHGRLRFDYMKRGGDAGPAWLREGCVIDLCNECFLSVVDSLTLLEICDSS